MSNDTADKNIKSMESLVNIPENNIFSVNAQITK